MNGLRWILLIAGVVLIAAIYIWGRRSRRTAVNDATTAPRAQAIPQLDEVIPGSKRVVETPVAMRASTDDFQSAALPPMHANGSPDSSRAGTKQMPPSPLGSREPRIGEFSTNEWSATGSHKTEPTLSESVLAAANFSQTGSQRSLKITASPDHQSGQAANISGTTSAQHTSNADSVEHSAPKKIVSKRKIVALRLSAGAIPVDGARLKSLLEAVGLRHGKYSIYHRLHDNDSLLFSVASMVEPGTFDPYTMDSRQFPGVTLFAQLPGAMEGMEIFAQMLSCARELERAIGGVLQDERGLPLTEQRVERLREDIADFLHLLQVQ